MNRFSKAAIVGVVGVAAVVGVGMVGNAAFASTQRMHGGQAGHMGQPNANHGTSGQGGMMNGRGGGGMMNGSGQHTQTLAAQGTLTADQKTQLARMAEEEKLAHDLYVTFGDKYDARVFQNISGAEQRHLDEVRSLLTRYQVTDPTAGKAAGSFSDPAIQSLYNDLLAKGSASEQAAFEAGKAVEVDDIAQLDKAKAGVTAPDALQVYGNLRAGSEKHLAAFNRQIG